MPHTLRANSITADCMPRHRPRYGILFSRAYWIVRILPSTPREPNPPGTMIPSTPSNTSLGSTDVSSSSSESIQRIFTLVPVAIPA